MKIWDKFLKLLKTDNNTFFCYLFTLITIYICFDRLVEMLLMTFTGIGQNYWRPIGYTIALMCPVLAFVFSGGSKFNDYKNQKITLFYVFSIGFSIITISMLTTWINLGAWLLFLSVPNYANIISEFSYLVKPAFASLTLYIPLAASLSIFKFLYLSVGDNKDIKDSITDFDGLNINKKKDGTGPYSYGIYMCSNEDTGKKIMFSEQARERSLFVCGRSGSGKTTLVVEPMIARDLKKKAFFRDVSKELGYSALLANIAYLNAPYDNNYINSNFSLSMLSPVSGYEKTFKEYFKKLIIGDGNDIAFRDLGITLISPDIEVIDNLKTLCKGYGFNYNLIDPNNPDSIGLNPFVYSDPNKIAMTISSCIKAMYFERKGSYTEIYNENVSIQAIENIAILLKEMYPRLHEGAIPNMGDLLQMLINFELVEKMSKIMDNDVDFSKKYANNIEYFKNNFYKNSPGYADTKKNLKISIAQLDSLLRIPGVKNILCNRYNNLNIDTMLKECQITFLCTRRGDLGANASKAFGLFFLIALEDAVLRRPGSYKSRLPNFLYIDEFPAYLCTATEPIFTMFRKFRVSSTITAQNLAQLKAIDGQPHFQETILSNTPNKIFTGDATIDELTWWQNEFGKKREWTMNRTMDMENLKYKPDAMQIKWAFTDAIKTGKLQSSLNGNKIAYKILNESGKPQVGIGVAKREDLNEKQKPSKTYNYTNFQDDATKTKQEKSFNPSKVDFDNSSNDPIINAPSKSNDLFEEQDSAVINYPDLKNLFK